MGYTRLKSVREHRVTKPLITSEVSRAPETPDGVNASDLQEEKIKHCSRTRKEKKNVQHPDFQNTSYFTVTCSIRARAGSGLHAFVFNEPSARLCDNLRSARQPTVQRPPAGLRGAFHGTRNQV